MLEKRIKVIEPTVKFSDINLDIKSRKIRVCAYARVSTDHEDQLNSYRVQIEEYTERIKKHPDWIFQGMYADEGISGTSIKNRKEFQRMIQDAKNGEIDLILTKSLSRFARNTVDSLTVIQEMRRNDVEIIFEKENLSSMDTKVDFLLTIFSSIAQEESRNMSENIKWGYRKKFQKGEVHINTKRFLGYDKDEDGKIIINEEQAKVVRMIFNLYLSGMSTREISNNLTNNNYENGRGEVFWKPATVMTILTNEKYCGDAILQKRVTIDYLTHKSVINTGQAPKYHIMNNHIPIVSRELFEMVQQLKKDRYEQNKSSRFRNRYPLSGIVYCAECHKKLSRKHHHPNTKNSRVTLSCKHTGTSTCSCKPIDNQTLELTIADAIKHLNISNPNLVKDFTNMLGINLDLTVTYDEIKTIHKSVETIEKEIKELIELRIASSDTKEHKSFQDIYNEKTLLLESLNTKENDLRSKLATNHSNKQRLVQINEFLSNSSSFISKDVISTIIQNIIVLSNTEIVINISKTKFTNTLFINSLKSILNSKPIITSSYTNEKNNISIKYNIVEPGDLKNEY